MTTAHPDTPRSPRRPVLHALAFALAAFGLGASASIAAAEDAATENANVEVVNDFMAAWTDPDRAVTFLAENASVRMVEDQPPVVGRAAIAAAFKGFLTPGVTLKVETFETTARGPVVVNRRIDTMKTPDKPDQVFPVIGVFVVKNGKIIEWTDYLDN
jgi:limonene-1,2-epoxide hydrolase